MRKREKKMYKLKQKKTSQRTNFYWNALKRNKYSLNTFTSNLLCHYTNYKIKKLIASVFNYQNKALVKRFQTRCISSFHERVPMTTFRLHHEIQYTIKTYNTCQDELNYSKPDGVASFHYKVPISTFQPQHEIRSIPS